MFSKIKFKRFNAEKESIKSKETMNIRSQQVLRIKDHDSIYSKLKLNTYSDDYKISSITQYTN